MPKLSPVVALDKLLSDLVKEWREHRDTLTRIEAVFSKYGIDPSQSQAGRRTQPATSRPANAAAPTAGRKRRKRRRFEQTADEFILGLLSGGGKSPTTAQINAEWIKSGRAGKADNTLTKMVKEKRLKREAVKNGRGSKYSAA